MNTGSNREPQILHRTSAGAIQRIFEGGGSFFKATFDILVPVGSGGISVDIWDYGSPLLDASPALTPPTSYLLFVTDFDVLWGPFAPVPGTPIAGGGTIDVNLCAARHGDGSTPSIATVAFTAASSPQYSLNHSVNSPLPVPGVTIDPTWANIQVTPGSAVTTAGYIRCVVFGKIL
jgi:hypothetical protein